MLKFRLNSFTVSFSSRLQITDSFNIFQTIFCISGLNIVKAREALNYNFFIFLLNGLNANFDLSVARSVSFALILLKYILHTLSSTSSLVRMECVSSPQAHCKDEEGNKARRVIFQDCVSAIRC